MTKEQISSITIGAAYFWHRDGPLENRLDESATAHHVAGMQAGLTANLGPTQGHGRWSFEVFEESKRFSPPETSYNSKEDALEGLKVWLRSYVLTDTPAAAKGE